MPGANDVDIAALESDEGDAALSNKKVNKVFNRARIQDGTCNATANHGDRSHFYFSPPHTAAGHYRKG